MYEYACLKICFEAIIYFAFLAQNLQKLSLNILS